MNEISLVKRVKYAGDIHTELLKSGWDLDTATTFVNNIPDADVAPVCEIKNLQKEVKHLKHKLAHLTPCDACVYDPPSSFGGKPCAFCVAQGRIAEDD